LLPVTNLLNRTTATRENALSATVAARTVVEINPVRRLAWDQGKG
jgi:hypothetical protein